MSRRALGVVAGLGLLLLGASVPRTPLLVWNASASAPVGFYRVLDRPPRLADFVLVDTPKVVATLAAARGYLPLHVPLVKRVAALSGDFVCTRGDAVVVDGSIVALRVAFDHQGRQLPYWEGCRTLRRGELFLLMRDAPHSFDSRYFGPVRAASVIATLEPLWTR
jgi:conjugative transfer signal peptidase TraF